MVHASLSDTSGGIPGVGLGEGGRPMFRGREVSVFRVNYSCMFKFNDLLPSFDSSDFQVVWPAVCLPISH